MRRVLVTRPEPAASRTAGLLSRMGFEPVLLPLTDIVPLEVAGNAWPAKPDAVAISSANAVRHAPKALLAAIAGVPVFAVGERTGEVAREAGLNVVDDDSGEASRLVQRIANALTPGMQVLILCGRVRRDVLERGLAQSGLKAFVAETYNTLERGPSRQQVVAALGGQPVDAVLLYSAFTAEIFTRIIELPLFDKADYFVISERVAKILPDAARTRAYVAREPNEEKLLSLLPV